MRFEPSAKELYDAGICFYDKAARLVVPVSRCAELALCIVFSKYAPDALPGVSAASVSNGYKAAIFEAQLRARIAPSDAVDLKAEPLTNQGRLHKAIIEFNTGLESYPIDNDVLSLLGVAQRR
jgi:hypothetical protein